MSRVKLAYGLNEHEAQSLLHELSPDGVFPYELWQKAYSTYWKYHAAEYSRLYKVENPSFPETHSQPIKHCPADVYQKWMVDFFFELARRLSSRELEKGFEYIVESTYDEKSAISDSDRQYLFYPLTVSEKNIANVTRVEGLKDINVSLCSSDALTKIFPDTIAVDKIAAIHYLSVVLKYPLRQEVKGITQSLVDSVIKAAEQKTLSAPEAPSVLESAPAPEERSAEIQPPEQGSVIRIPAHLYEGKSDTAVRDAMRAEYHDSVIAYVMLKWCEFDKTRIGRLLTETKYSDHKSYRNLVDRLMEKASAFTIIKA